MWSKIEQWVFVLIPACHWSRMNNSAPVVEVWIREKKEIILELYHSGYFRTASCQCLFLQCWPSLLPLFSLPLGPPTGSLTTSWLKYRFLLCLAGPSGPLQTERTEEGSGGSFLVSLSHLHGCVMIFLSILHVWTSANLKQVVMMDALLLIPPAASFDGRTCNRQFTTSAFTLKHSYLFHYIGVNVAFFGEMTSTPAFGFALLDIHEEEVPGASSVVPHGLFGMQKGAMIQNIPIFLWERDACHRAVSHQNVQTWSSHDRKHRRTISVCA